MLNNNILTFRPQTMALLQLLLVLIEVTLSKCDSKIFKEAYYTKHITNESGAGLKSLECGVKYAGANFGVFKLSEDGMECTTEPWSWFDTQSMETGYTHYRKDRLKLTLNPPLRLISYHSEPRDEYYVLFPSPMLSDMKVDVYFTPKIPFDEFAVELYDATLVDPILRWNAFGTDGSTILMTRMNNAWVVKSRIFGNMPFIAETTYKVTIQATITHLQVFVDDQFLMEMDHARPTTDIRYVNVNVRESSEALLQAIEFFMT